MEKGVCFDHPFHIFESVKKHKFIQHIAYLGWEPNSVATLCGQPHKQASHKVVANLSSRSLPKSTYLAHSFDIFFLQNLNFGKFMSFFFVFLFVFVLTSGVDS